MAAFGEAYRDLAYERYDIVCYPDVNRMVFGSLRCEETLGSSRVDYV